MERISLASLVALAKQLSSNFTVYRPGMRITYFLPQSDHEMLQLEIHEHATKSVEGFKPKLEKFEFEVMEINFIFIPTIE